MAARLNFPIISLFSFTFKLIKACIAIA
jgi:hypothetical protein